MVMI